MDTDYSHEDGEISPKNSLTKQKCSATMAEHDKKQSKAKGAHAA